MLDELKGARKVIGIKQLRRALGAGSVRKVFLADDADPRLTDPLCELRAGLGVELERVKTMKELGKAGGIDIGAAAAGILR